MANRTGKMKDLKCLFCGREVSVDMNTRAVLCERCCTKLADAPALPTYLKKEVINGEVVTVKRESKTGFPRGWHLKKEYTHTDGSVWAKGKLVTPAPTVIENPDVPAEVTMSPVAEVPVE